MPSRESFPVFAAARRCADRSRGFSPPCSAQIILIGCGLARHPGKEPRMSTVRILVGTRKGAFILTSDGKRENWNVSGPHFAGWEMYHIKGSPADPNRLYASQSSGWFGQIIQRSDDGGKTWHQPGTPPGEAPAPGPPKAASNKFVYDATPETGKPLTTHH